MKSDSQLMFRVADLALHSMNGTLDEQDLQHLEELLGNNPLAVEYYMEVIWTHVGLNTMDGISCLQEAGNKTFDQDLWQALLQEEKSSPTIEVPQEEPERELIQKVVYPPREKKKPSKSSIFALVLYSAALIFLILWARFTPPAGGYPVGVLSNTVNAQWDDLNGQFYAGDSLYAESMSLKKGYAEIDFADGAKVIVQAPARFSLESSRQMYLERGRIVVKMNGESEQVFVVRSPWASIVDLGTEFGVEVTFYGLTETHVFEGQVQVHDSSEPLKSVSRLSLTAGQGAAVRDGEITATEIDPEKFVRSGKFRWILYSSRIRRDPSLVAYYTFEKDAAAPNKLKNAAISTDGRLTGDFYTSRRNGELPKWTEGRWPGTSALKFDREQGQVVVVPPDPALNINGPITIAAWIKLGAPEHGSNIVACREKKDRGIRGMANFQFSFGSSKKELERRMFFGKIDQVDLSDVKDRVYTNQTFSDSGRWTLVAVTYNNKMVTFYLDGALVETQQFEYYRGPVDEAYLTIGSDQIDGGSKFSGVIGELAIFKRVLSEKEVMDMYEAGKP